MREAEGTSSSKFWNEKFFQKKVAKKFGDYEKVRIFAVPKRKDGFTGLKFERKKFIENIEKTSSKIQDTEFFQSVNSFGNKE